MSATNTGDNGSSTVQNRMQVYGPVPFDGHKWHSVHSVDGNLVTTCCGEVFNKNDSSIRVSGFGESPPNLSGSTICYNCANSKAAEQLTNSEADE